MLKAKFVFTTLFFSLLFYAQAASDSNNDINNSMNSPNAGSDIATLRKALCSGNQFARRAAVRELILRGDAGRESLIVAMENPDPIVRKAAFYSLIGTCASNKRFPLLEKALSDKSAYMKLAALKILLSIKPRTKKVARLLRIASKDKMPIVHLPAKRALFPFYKNTIPFRKRIDVADHIARIKIVAKIELPPDNWKFKIDPLLDGHTKHWFAEKFNDTAWRNIKTGKFWDDFGIKHIGIAWYRTTFKLPDKPDLSVAEIHFGAVDETAWVWVNGRYAGQHDIGPSGWDREFSIDLSDLVRWGRDNQITVRVLNTKAAGGIWKPVYVEALKL